MARVAILVPLAEMRDLALPLVAGYSNITLMCLESIQSPQVAARARELEAQGCELIVARGVQAQIIKRSVALPVVEIQITTQELELVMMDLKQTLGGGRPCLGLICFANMVGDTSHIHELLGIELKTYLVDLMEELPDAVVQAKRDGCQAVIGGDIVCERANTLGLMYRFLPSGTESLRNALSTASRVCYAIDQEKRNSAEMDIMLNSTFNGIMKVDRDGRILRMNHAGYALLERSPDDLPGRMVSEVLPGLKRHVLEAVLSRGDEAYDFFLNARRKAVVVNIAPIRVNNEIEGAILTFQEGERISEMDSELRREMYQRGYVAKYSFDKLVCGGKETAELIKVARRIAKYSAPILLTGETGSGKDIMAQCIHRESLFRDNAFVPVDCSAWQPETLDGMLFGSRLPEEDDRACIAQLAQDGTLYLSHVEGLTLEMQYKLLSLIRGKFIHNRSNRPVAANVRVIVSSDDNQLFASVEQGAFRRDLYYTLSALRLELPPLRRRREDIVGWVQYFLNQWQEQYSRHVHLTKGAWQFIRDYKWPGNLNQVSSICERIVLLSERRNVDEVFLRTQLEEIAPKLLPGTEQVVVFRDEKAVEISELLRKHRGNREKVAAELGISKTTLWRYMKKYGIEANYS